ncbi:MAG: HD domain-containing phosphohydrolase [candidate division KSB1 bacterium]|nr:HD domain-containing phosphohydrolase [candidate division KSB1 bacterium]
MIAQQSITLVVSDFRMPTMDGVTFLEKVRKINPDTIRMLLTGFADAESAIRAINNGQVFRYLKKPIKESELLEALLSGIQQYELVAENRRLMRLTQQQNEELKRFNHELEKLVLERSQEIIQQKRELERLYTQLDNSFTEIIRAFMTLVEMKNPNIGGHSRRVAALSRRFSEFLEIPKQEVRDIEVAALLHDIGKITLPDEILETPKSELSSQQMDLLNSHPEIGASILNDIPDLKTIAKIVEAHHENYDGSGFPKKWKAQEIPIGARIIAILNTFDHFISKEQLERSLRLELAIEYLKAESGKRFDAHFVHRFIEFLKSSANFKRALRVISVDLGHLEAGMMLAGDVRTESGLLLLRKDQILNSIMIQRLHHYHKIDPIVMPIQIFEGSN